jgi:hypothetical protein
MVKKGRCYKSDFETTSAIACSDSFIRREPVSKLHGIFIYPQEYLLWKVL